MINDDMINEDIKKYMKVKEFIIDRFSFYTRMTFHRKDLLELKVYTR